MKRLAIAVAVVIAVGFALVPVFSGEISSFFTKREKPNFLIIILDDWGWEDSGVYGNEYIKTPAIDRLASEGMKFQNAFLTTSSCSPSRASILSAKYPTTVGAPHLHDPTPQNQIFISELLRSKAGYYTASAGKWHLGHVKDKFETVFKEQTGGDSGTNDWLQVVKNRPKNKPFFFWFASRDPHAPYARENIDKVHSPENVEVPPYLYDSPGARKIISYYYDEIHRTDSAIETVLAELENQEVLDNTVVVVMSDNGAPFPRAKRTLYDSGIKTPLIIRWGDRNRGTEPAALVSSIDIAPTLLQLAGLTVPEYMQGKSFTHLMKDPNQFHRKYIFAEQNNHGIAIKKRAVRTESHLLIKNYGLGDNACEIHNDAMGKEMRDAYKRGRLTELQSFCFRNSMPRYEIYDVNADSYSQLNLAINSDMDTAFPDLTGALKVWTQDNVAPRAHSNNKTD